MQDSCAVVIDGTGLPVQQLRRAAHGGAKGHGDRLVTEAHTEDGDVAATLLNQRDADARLLRHARSWGEQYAVVRPAVRGRHLVVAPDLAVRAELTEILDQVENEAVVVVDDEDAGHGPPPRACSA